MSNIHILTNPLSGKNRKQPTRFDKMMSVAKEHCAPENTLTTHQPHGLDALLESVQSMKEAGADILCIDGGDGTIHQAFTALWKVYGMDTPYPTIALLKGGTMNNIARNVGVGFGPLPNRSSRPSRQVVHSILYRSIHWYYRMTQVMNVPVLFMAMWHWHHSWLPITRDLHPRHSKVS